MNFHIGLKEVIKKISDGGENHSFSLTYRKENGKLGAKQDVKSRFSDVTLADDKKRALSSIDKQTQSAGKLHLIESSGRIFDLTICLLVSYNGKLIDHTR